MSRDPPDTNPAQLFSTLPMTPRLTTKQIRTVRTVDLMATSPLPCRACYAVIRCPGSMNPLRVHSPRLSASSSYRRKPDRGPGQAPVSRGLDWIPCQARNDGPEQETIPRGLLRGSSFPWRPRMIHLLPSLFGESDRILSHSYSWP